MYSEVVCVIVFVSVFTSLCMYQCVGVCEHFGGYVCVFIYVYVGTWIWLSLVCMRTCVSYACKRAHMLMLLCASRCVCRSFH